MGALTAHRCVPPPMCTQCRACERVLAVLGRTRCSREAEPRCVTESRAAWCACTVALCGRSFFIVLRGSVQIEEPQVHHQEGAGGAQQQTRITHWCAPCPVPSEEASALAIYLCLVRANRLLSRGDCRRCARMAWQHHGQRVPPFPPRDAVPLLWLLGARHKQRVPPRRTPDHSSPPSPASAQPRRPHLRTRRVGE